ncbi:MAG: GGDEF domain-containing protein, partial [Methylophilaceae bacterium]|nr:GGDEF domain-containing protein [Methylophilaceae bacterium]
MSNFIDSKRKVIFLLWILLCVGFFATSIASYYVSKHSIRDSIVTSELPLTADNIYSEIQKDLIRPIFISSMMA